MRPLKLALILTALVAVLQGCISISTHRDDPHDPDRYQTQ